VSSERDHRSRMGNAVCTVNFPNSLTADEPSMTSGQVVQQNVPGMIRLEKTSGTACGLEGRITFRKNVKNTEWSYKKTNSSERGLTFTTERSSTVDAIQEKAEVQTKIAASLNISVQEVRENYTVHKINIDDRTCYTELQVGVDYNGQNQGRAKFMRNDLNLEMEKIRWGKDSEMILTLHLPGQKGKCHI